MTINTRLLQKIDEKKQEILSLSQKLVQFKSVNPPGNEEEISNFLAKKLKAMGFEVRQIEYAKGRPNIIAVKKGTTGKKRLLCYGHLDVVPAGDLSKWEVDPFAGTIIGDKLHGRGSQDHKFPISPFLYAWESLNELGIKLKGDLVFNFVVDEESGGVYGFKRLMEDGHFDDTDSLIYGGIGSVTSEAVVIGCNGTTKYLITVNGKGAHTAYLEDGTNAIVNAAKLIIELQKLADKVNARKDPITGTARMSINLIEGGTRLNVVPDRCIITIDRRTTPSESGDQATREILQVLEASRKMYPGLDCKLDVEEGFPAASSDPKAEIIEILKQSAKVVIGKNLNAVGMPASSDYAWYIKRLNRPIAMYAVANAPLLAHAPKEFAYIQDIIDTTKVYALTFANYLGTED